MTTLAPAPASDGTIQLATVKVRHLKLPVTLAIATALLALLFLFVPRNGISTFRLSDPSSAIALPNLSVPTAITCWILIGLLVLGTLDGWAELDHDQSPVSSLNDAKV
jgi:simple sugar transport system permease protein